MTTTDEHVRGWALAPTRLPEEHKRSLRGLHTAAHAVAVDGVLSVSVILHVDREDARKRALAMLGADVPHVLVQVSTGAGASVINANVYAMLPVDPAKIASTPLGERLGGVTQVATHKFRRGTHRNEWVRILSRHCRHALGVLALLRAEPLSQVFSSTDVSKVVDT